MRFFGGVSPYLFAIIFLNLFSPNFSNAGDYAWTGLGPYGGVISALAVDPADRSNIYAGTASSGVFKSASGGGTWNAINNGLPNLYVGSLAIDPINSRIVYAGIMGGVYKSADGGSTWNSTGSLPGLGSLTTVNSLVIAPTSSQIIYAGTQVGLYRSIDGGSNWSCIRPSGSTSLTVDPTAPDTIYVGGVSGVHKSVDGGATWTFTFFPSFSSTNSLAILPNSPQTIYAGTTAGMYRSINGGTSWAAANVGEMTSATAVHALAINPTLNFIYAGTSDGVFMSINGGNSWQRAGMIGINVSSIEIGWYGEGLNIPDLLLCGTNTGVFQDVGYGLGMLSVNTNLTGFFVPSLAVDPTSADTIYAAAQQGGGFKSMDGGNTWNRLGLTGSVGLLTIDPTSAETVYAVTSSGAFKSFNGGSSWTQLGADTLPTGLNALVIAPTSPQIIYAGKTVFTTVSGITTIASTVYRSTDGGSTWISPGASLNVPISSLTVDPTSADTVYAYGFIPGNFIYKSMDGGGTWSTIATPGGTITALAIAPTLPPTIYAGILVTGQSEMEVYKSMDGGSTWIPMGLKAAFIFSLGIEPASAETVYAGADEGLFKSSDSGNTWISTELPPLSVRSLALSSTAPSKIYAGTSNGVWSLFTNQPPVAKICAVKEPLIVGSTGLASVQLDGSCSSDPDSDPLTYKWSIGPDVLTDSSIIAEMPAGIHTVSLTVNDGKGGANTTLISFEVLSAGQATLYLSDVLAGFNAEQGISIQLGSKLNNVEAALNDINSWNRVDAANKLRAFINSVEAQRGKKLTDAQVDSLTKTARMIMGSI